MPQASKSVEHFNQEKQQWQQSQVVEVLFGNALGAILGNLVNIMLVTYLLSSIYPGWPLLAWFGFGICFEWYPARSLSLV